MPNKKTKKLPKGKLKKQKKGQANPQGFSLIGFAILAVIGALYFASNPVSPTTKATPGLSNYFGLAKTPTPTPSLVPFSTPSTQPISTPGITQFSTPNTFSSYGSSNPTSYPTAPTPPPQCQYASQISSTYSQITVTEAQINNLPQTVQEEANGRELT